MVLLLKFDAPMQSWGTSLKLLEHPTDAYPSKSGVLGMVASAMGLRRDDDVSVQWLASEIRFGVRIDTPGQIIRDYQTSRYGAKRNENKISPRFYLSDAHFTCGLEGAEDILNKIKNALLHPAFPLYLGRRSCPVTAELVDEIVEGGLENVLKNDESNKRILVESKTSADYIVKDNPVSFSPERRRFGHRNMVEI